MLTSIEAGPWDHGLASLGQRLVPNERIGAPEGLVVGKAFPEHAVDHASDEAASDPPSEVGGPQQQLQSNQVMLKFRMQVNKFPNMV